MTILRHMVVRCEDRLNKSMKRRRADTIRMNGCAMTDLKRPAVVIPFRNEMNVQLFQAMGATAQTQTYQSGQAQVETALSIRQDLRALCLRGLPGILTGPGRKPLVPRAESRNAGVVHKFAGRWLAFNFNTANGRHLLTLGIGGIRAGHVSASGHAEDQYAG